MLECGEHIVEPGEDEDDTDWGKFVSGVNLLLDLKLYSWSNLITAKE